MAAFLEMANGLYIPPSRNGHSRLAEAWHIELLESRLAELEARLQEQGWARLDGGGQEFSRQALDDLVDLARVSYLRNPLINRAVEVGALYVYGQDLSVSAEDPDVQTVVDRFWRGNRATLTGQQASRLLEVELQVTGNVFLALFPDRVTGEVRVRTVPVEEIRSIVANPDDRYEPWFYKRVWREQPVGGAPTEPREAFYPDWRSPRADRPEAIGGVPVRWESPLLHVKVGAFPHWSWGVPEVYAALDWSRAYKEALEDDATRSRALARFAWSLTTKGGKDAIAAAKAKLGTTLGVAGGLGAETNPPPVGGSMFLAGEGVNLQPLRIAGATLDPDHSRPIRLMAAAALGLPECYSADTEVLTDAGWMRHDEWRPGIRVACFDPETGLVDWAHPRALTEHYYNGEMIHFANAQTDILVTPNHRMWTAPVVQWKLLPAAVERNHRGGRRRAADGGVAVVDRAWQIRLAEDVADSPRSAGWRFTSAVRFSEPSPPGTMTTPIGEVDAVAWARFVGYWVAEGSAPASVCKSGEFRKDGTPIMRTFRRVVLSQREGAVLDRMRATLHELGVHFLTSTVTGGVRNLIVYRKALWGYLRASCGEGSHTKRLPDDLLTASADVRRALFDALMEGDGGRSGSSLRYSTVSERLADQVQLLAISLGYGASVGIDRCRYRGEERPISRVHIRTRLTDTTLIKPRHVRRVAYAGFVYCFSVPSGIYVTRRNGKVAIQGNTFFGDADVGNHATAKTLDRPTELRFGERRQLWRDVLGDLVQWVIDRDLAATRGLLRGRRLTEQERSVDLSWPDLLEHSAGERVQAVVDAATLAGRAPAGTVAEETLSRLLLVALGVEDVDDEIEKAATERAERRRAAERIARQTQRQPPGDDDDDDDDDDNPPVPMPEALARIAEVGEDGTLTLADLTAIVAWWDEAVPEHAGSLNARLVADESDDGE